MAPLSETVNARSVASALRTLGLDESAGWKEVRAAYALKVKQAHPDSNAGRGSRFLLERALRAYRVLKDAYPGEMQRAPAQPARATVGFGELGQTALMASDPDDRKRACVKLGQTGKRSAAAYLRAALYDDDDRVVVASATALGHLKVRAASGDYRCIYESASTAVRVSVVRAAIETGPAECFRELFVHALRDGERAVRRAALTGLSRLDTAVQV